MTDKNAENPKRAGSVSLIDGHIDPDKSRKKKGITVEHKGYILQQGSTCPHYMIFKADKGGCCMHAQCTEYLTEEGAREHIEMYLKLIGTPEIFEGDDEE